jgi:P-type Cu2+ transporter
MKTMKPARPTVTPRQTPALAVMKSAPELEERIRRRAYELYEQRGREDGHELDDWLQAESEVTQKKANPVAA